MRTNDVFQAPADTPLAEELAGDVPGSVMKLAAWLIWLS
jgi:hypothetical protein